MQSSSSLVRGQVVRSIAGRDADRFFVVVEIVDEKTVALVDGKLRPLARPKKKKVKHLQKTNHFIDVEPTDVPLCDRYIRRQIAHIGA